MKAVSSVLFFLSVFVATVSAELSHGKRSSRVELAHAHKVRASELELEGRSDGHTLHKRFGPARMTFYDVGLGACGWWNNAGDYIVAVNSAQFGGYAVYPPAICGKHITISYNGKQAGAIVADECPTCGYGELDLSRGLFNNFASEGEGVFNAEWWFNDGGSAPQPQPQPQPQPTTTQAPSPTTTYQAQPQPTTTRTPEPQPTTSTQQQQQTTSSTSSTPSSVSYAAPSSVSTSEGLSIADASTSSSIPTSSNTPATETKQNLQDMCSVVVHLGNLIVQAAGHQLTVNAK